MGQRQRSRGELVIGPGVSCMLLLPAQLPAPSAVRPPLPISPAHLIAWACSSAAVPATMGQAMDVPHICL